MSEIKRVWSGKRITRNNKEQVWEKDGELKVYDGQWKDVDGDIDVYKGSQFDTLPGSAELDVYDTNDPTFIGTVEDGINAAYVFKDWDGTVLKTGRVKDGGTPTPPANPTREHYDFTGWNPEVGPIFKSTEYIAQYELNTTIIINEDLSTTNVEVGDTFKCYFTCPNPVTFSDSTMWLEDTTLTIEGGYKVYSGTVIAAGTYTLTISDNVVPGMSASLTVVSVIPPRYRINEHTRLYVPLETNLDAQSYTGSVSYEVLGNSSNITFHYDQGMRYAEFAKTSGENGGFVKYAIGEIGTKENQTATVWLKPAVLGEWLVAWFEKNWDNQGIANNSKWFATHGRSSGDQISNITADRAWHMLTVTAGDDSTTGRIKVYVDGQLALNFMSGEPDATVTEVMLGGRWITSAECGWNGGIADFIVEDTTWDAQTVADYYNYTKDRYPIPTYTVTIESNDDTKGTVDVSTVTAELGSTVVVNDNTITIGETTVTATAESGEYFFTWTNVPATITDDITITANFVDDLSNPSLTFDFGTITAGTFHKQEISVPSYNVASVNITGTTGANPERWGGTWMAISNDDGTFSAASSSKWFGSYFFVGSKQSTDYAYNGEYKDSPNSVVTMYTEQDLGYGGIPTAIDVTINSTSGEYIYGADSSLYDFSDYSYDIAPLLERDDLNVFIRGDGCSFDGAQVVVTYERSHITDLDNLSSNDVSVYTGQTTSVTFDYVPTDAVDLDQSLSIYSVNNYCSVDWNKTSDGTIQIDITGLDDGSYQTQSDQVYIDLDGDTVYSISVSVVPYVVTSVSNLSANSITLEPQEAGFVTFDYSPTDADTNVVDIINSDDNVVYAELTDNGDGTMNIELAGISVGTATIEVLLDSQSTGLTVAVTVDYDNIKSVSNLSASSISMQENDSDSSITFNYSPTDAADTTNVSIVSDDDNIATASLSDLGNGVMEVDIDALSAGTATLDIQLDGASTGLTITVTVTAPTPPYTFSNSIQESNNHVYCFSDGTQGSPVVIVWDNSGTTTVQTDGIFADANYTVEIDPDDYHNAWEYVFGSLDSTQLATLMTYQAFDQTTWDALEELYNNPSTQSAGDAQTALVDFLGGI